MGRRLYKGTQRVYRNAITGIKKRIGWIGRRDWKNNFIPLNDTDVRWEDDGYVANGKRVNIEFIPFYRKKPDKPMYSYEALNGEIIAIDLADLHHMGHGIVSIFSNGKEAARINEDNLLSMKGKDVHGDYPLARDEINCFSYETHNHSGRGLVLIDVAKEHIHFVNNIYFIYKDDSNKTYTYPKLLKRSVSLTPNDHYPKSTVEIENGISSDQMYALAKRF